MIRRILLLWLLVASATSHSLAISRPTGYGAVPGYRPVAFGNGVNLAQSSAWRGREVDVTGYYHLGLRDYDPVSGQWLSYDPMWNAGDPNGQSFCGGDPINGTDPNGLCVEAVVAPAEAVLDFAFPAADTVWNIGIAALAELGAAQEATPQEANGIVQVALQHFGSPFENMGFYDPTPLSTTLTQELPVQFGQPVANLALAYGAQPGVAPVEFNVPEPDYSGPQISSYVAGETTGAESAFQYQQLKASLTLQEQLGTGNFVTSDTLELGQTRVAVYDLDSGQIYIGNQGSAMHIGVVDQYALTPGDNLLGGFIKVGDNGQLGFDATSGSFPLSTFNGTLNNVRGTGVSIIGTGQ